MSSYNYNFKSYKYINSYCVLGSEPSGREHLAAIACISVVLCKKKNVLMFPKYVIFKFSILTMTMNDDQSHGI